MSTITTPTQLTGTYTIDPGHTSIGFVARHAMVTKVHGNFTDFDGSISIDAEDPSNSSAQVTVRTFSVDTRNAARDKHLRSSDFFDMALHPLITFVSTAIDRIGTTDFRMTGDLTIKGVIRPVTVDVEFLGAATDPSGNERIGFTGRTTVNRTDWGLNWNAALEAGGVLVSDKVTIELDVSAIKDA
jgi:polyisoprenoid-binding protein YceI